VGVRVETPDNSLTPQLSRPDPVEKPRGMEEKFQFVSAHDPVSEKAPETPWNICEKSGLNPLRSIIERDPSEGCQKSDI
jgi:hypothetical protein